MAPSSGRNVTIVRIGIEPTSISRRPGQDRYEPAMTMQPDGDAQGVVLDAAGLDLAQAAAGALTVARPMPLTVPSTTLAVEPPHGVGDAPADDHEEQVVEVVEPPLVERGAVQERRPGR